MFICSTEICGREASQGGVQVEHTKKSWKLEEHYSVHSLHLGGASATAALGVPDISIGGEVKQIRTITLKKRCTLICKGQSLCRNKNITIYTLYVSRCR